MNRRQKKKYDKKFGMKSYYNVRRYKIYMMASKYTEDPLNGHCIIYVVDSKRGDLKHPVKISLLTNVVPIGMS